MSRGRFVARRLLQGIPTVLGVTVLVFFLIHLVPGDPARALLGPRATPGTIRQIHEEFGLDRPLYAQYGLFLERLVHGDLGQSIFHSASVSSLVVDRLPLTALLILLAVLLTVVVTVPLATAAAVWRDRPVDHAVRALPVVGLGMPSFWIGVMLILVFALKIPLFPVGGWGDGVLGALHSAILPALTIAIGITPITIRSLRASMIGVLDADFVATARAKGLGTGRVVGRHVLRNAAIPTITVLSVNIGFLIGGTVVIEQVFAIPGLGQLMFDGISNRDFAVVQGVTLVFAVGVVLLNIATDVVYSIIDPRVALR
ncbi:MAG: ABC transporter permease [Actinomycetota bacterium]|nr:ABC transporter permease [Actinomycetota bacterium]